MDWIFNLTRTEQNIILFVVDATAVVLVVASLFILKKRYGPM